MDREGTEKHRDRLDQKHNSAVVAWAQNGRARLVPREGSSAPVRPRAGRATYPSLHPGRNLKEGAGLGVGGRFGETEVLGQWGRGKPQLAERGGALGRLPLHISERRLRGPLSVPAAVSHDVEQVTHSWEPH